MEGAASQDESRPYVVGPSVELRLPKGFAVEVDALYRRVGTSYGYSTSTLLGDGSLTNYYSRVRGNSWEFPILGKFYFRGENASWRPYASTGYAFRETWFTADSLTTVNQNGAPVTYAGKEESRRFDVGAVIGGGVQFRRGRLALSPEFRYTRWGGSDFERLKKNQAEVLVGISF